MIKEFNIKKNDIISITGAGGKTSLLFSLALDLSKYGKVLVTTTTKIFVPLKEQYNHLCLGNISLPISENSITVFGEKIENEKIWSASLDKIENISQYFDYILIEADGTMGKPLKGWKENEPQIPSFSTKTIAVIDVSILGMPIDDINVHRLDLFNRQFNSSCSNVITLDILTGYIYSNNLFKNSSGENYLFFNKIESLCSFKKFFTVANALKFKNIIWGSIKENNFYTYKEIIPIVMASGFSRRLGTDKLSTILPNGLTVLENTLLSIDTVPFNKKVIVGKNLFTKEVAKRNSYLYLENNNSHLGQSESIKLAINNIQTDGYMFIPGDMPFLNEDTLFELIYNFEKSNEIVVPTVKNELFAPLIFPKKFRPNFLELSGDSGGKKLLKNNSFVSVNFNNPQIFLDIDTPEDLSLVINFFKNQFGGNK